MVSLAPPQPSTGFCSDVGETGTCDGAALGSSGEIRCSPAFCSLSPRGPIAARLGHGSRRRLSVCGLTYRAVAPIARFQQFVSWQGAQLVEVACDRILEDRSHRHRVTMRATGRLWHDLFD